MFNPESNLNQNQVLQMNIFVEKEDAASISDFCASFKEVNMLCNLILIIDSFSWCLIINPQFQ